MPVIASALFIVVAAYACYDRSKLYSRASSLALFAMMVSLPLTVLVERVL